MLIVLVGAADANIDGDDDNGDDNGDDVRRERMVAPMRRKPMLMLLWRW